MRTTPRFGLVSKYLTLFIVVAFGNMPLRAENVFVTSYKGTEPTADITPCPPSCPSGASLSGASTSSTSTATPTPVIPASGRRVIFGNTSGAQWNVTPTDIELTPVAGGAPHVFTSLQNVGAYKVYVTKGASANASPDILVEMTATGGELADADGNAAGSVVLDVFQSAKPINIWVHVGYITNDTPNPTLTFKHISGAIASTGGRWLMDAVWFEFVDDCAGVASQVGVDGPLVQGQEFVNVTGVTEGATAVKAFSDGFEIGQITSDSGFAGGTIQVPVSPLFKGNVITAQQTVNNCSSAVPGSGPVVGGGPNAAVRVFLGCWKNEEFAGPIGADTTSGLTQFYFLKATGLTAGFNSAPTGGWQLFPGRCWQTVTFDHSQDPGMIFNTGQSIGQFDPFCALEGLAFAIDDMDSGPYKIYVDEIKNGDVVIEDFEAYEVGTTSTFNAPNQAPNPSASATYLSAPNSSLISQEHAFQGNKALEIQWQWTSTANILWAHVRANAPSGKRYPQLDTSKPITIRFLVLPVGETESLLTLPVVPANQTRLIGDSVTFTVEAAGNGPFNYQWFYEGGSIPDATNTSYTKAGLQEGDSGVYSVSVFDSSFLCNAVAEARLTVTDEIPVPILNFSVSDGQITLTWEGDFILQSTTEVTGSWSDVTGTSGHQEPLNSSTTRFFALRLP